jgi:hypothetical protein
VDVVIDKAANGKKLTLKEVKGMIAEATKQQEVEGDKRIERLKKSYDKQVEDLRRELSLSLTPDMVDKAINEALAPLRKKIERQEKQLKEKRERIQIPHVVEVSAIKGGLRALSLALVISPGDLIAAQKKISQAVGQSVDAALSDDIESAKKVSAWLKTFLKETT